MQVEKDGLGTVQAFHMDSDFEGDVGVNDDELGDLGCCNLSVQLEISCGGQLKATLGET